MSDANVPVPRTPHARHRRWIATAAAVFLTAQLLLPLHYYLAPTADERFAWRMFSTTGSRPCVATMYQTIEQDGRRIEVEVPPMVLAPWQNSLNSHRPDIAEMVMRSCCQRPGVVGVRFRLSCRSLDGTDLPAEQWWMDRESHRMRAIETAAP